jgi:hypothetical protein
MILPAKLSPTRLAVLGLSLALACTKTSEDAPARSRPAPQRAPATERPPKAEAKALSAADYWKAVALQRIVNRREDGDTVWLEIGDADASHPAKIDRAALEDGEARDRGYRAAIEELVTRLHEPDSAGQAAAIDQLQRLTRTERGGPHAWMDWHDESGDFLVFNEGLNRVDVDTERKHSSRPEAGDGLRLWAQLDKDRYKVDEPIELSVRLENAHEKSGDLDDSVWVNRRLALGSELFVEVRHNERNEIAVLPQKPIGSSPSPTAEHFQKVGGTRSIDRRIELTRVLEEPTLPPGKYAVDVRYVNAHRGDALGLAPTERSKQLPGGGPAWTGELQSLTLLFEVVPW